MSDRKRYRFGTRRRDYLWWRDSTNAVRDGRGPHPICVHCDQPVHARDDWDECHVGAPKALGGRRVGVGHSACNRRDNNLVVTPMVARAKKLAAIHAGTKGPGLGRFPMRAGRFSSESKTMRHGVQPRLTLAQKHARMLDRLAVLPPLPAARGEGRGEGPGTVAEAAP